MDGLFSLLPVPLSSIKEIRSGKNTETFREIERDNIPEDCAFSVIHGEDFMALDLVANNPDEANIWITGLRCLLDSDLSKFIYEILNIDIMQKLIVIVLLKLYTLEGIMRIFIYKEDQKLE